MLKNQKLLLIWILLSNNRPIFKFIFWAPNNHSRTCFSYWQYNGDELPIMSVARTIKITYHHLYWPLLFFAMPHKKITRFFKQPQTFLCIVYWVSEGELILPWQCSKFFSFFLSPSVFSSARPSAFLVFFGASEGRWPSSAPKKTKKASGQALEKTLVLWKNEKKPGTLPQQNQLTFTDPINNA